MHYGSQRCFALVANRVILCIQFELLHSSGAKAMTYRPGLRSITRAWFSKPWRHLYKSAYSSVYKSDSLRPVTPARDTVYGMLTVALLAGLRGDEGSTRGGGERSTCTWILILEHGHFVHNTTQQHRRMNQDE